MSSSSGIERPEKSDENLQSKLWRAPVLWLLIPAIAGYGAAHLFELSSTWQTLGPALFILAFSLPFHRQKLWYLSFPLGVFLLAWSWSAHRSVQPPAIWDELPPREVTVEGHIQQTYAGKTYPDRTYAIVLVTAPPALNAELKGQKFFASVRQASHDPRLQPSAKVVLKGVLSPVLTGDDEFTDFLNSRNINFQLRQGVLLEETQPPDQAHLWISSLKGQWAQWLSTSPAQFSSEAGLLAAMILGEREFLTTEQEQTFLAAGAMHLFAVSGLHVMIVGLTLDQLLKLLQISFFRRRLVTLCFVGLYVAVIGFSPSAVRAFSILAFYCLATLLPRPAKPVPIILASALITIAISPAQLFSVGFQLSYSVVLSILTFGLPLIDLLHERWPSYRLSLDDDLSRTQRFLRWLRRKSLESLCISFSATLGSAPLIILHFGLWTPGAIVLNAFLIPLATVAVACGVICILVHSIGLGFATFIVGYPAWILIRAMERLSFGAIHIPGFYSELRWHSPEWAYSVLVCFLGALLLAPKKQGARRRTLYLGGTTIALLSLMLIGTHPV